MSSTPYRDSSPRTACTPEPGKQKSQRLFYNLKILVGLALMFGFQFLPAPEPITQTGMAVIGCFLGIVFLVAVGELVWPAFAAICLFAFYAKDVYPHSVQDAAIYEASMQSIGHWITLFLIAMLLFCHALNEEGVLRRISLWFVTRKIAQRGPWTFTFMFLLSGLVLGSFMDPVPAAMVMIMLAHEVFKALGFKPGDSWPRMVVACIPYTVTLSFAMTPIGHNLAIMIMGLISDASGEPINIVSYMLVGIPIGLIIWGLMFLYFRFFVRPDTSHFDSLDFSALEQLRPGKMGLREKILTAVSLAVLLAWLIPGFLTILAPDAGITRLFNDLTLLFPILAAVVLLAILRPEGRPLLDLIDAFQHISWTVVFLFAGIILVSMSLVEETTGVPQWVSANIAPLVSGFSPYIAIAIMTILSIILTNILSNLAVGVVFASVSAPIMIAMGVNPAIVAVAIAFGVNCAFTTPAASTVTTFSVSDPHCDSNYVLRHGIVMTVISVIVAGLLMYPLGALFYGT